MEVYWWDIYWVSMYWMGMYWKGIIGRGCYGLGCMYWKGLAEEALVTSPIPGDSSEKREGSSLTVTVAARTKASP